MNLFKRNEAGLTLIEVLIALVILSIALTSIIKSSSQSIRNTLYLQNKTIATWIGIDGISNIRMGLLKVPNSPDHLTQKNETLGQHWSWQATMETTPNPRIKQILLDVFHLPDNAKLVHLESYVYTP